MGDDQVILNFPIKCPVGAMADHPSFPPFVEVVEVMALERVICWEKIISEEYPDDFEEADWLKTAPILEIAHLWAKVHVGELREIARPNSSEREVGYTPYQPPHLYLVE